MGPFERLQWNPRNIAHIARQGVSILEVQEVTRNNHTTEVSRDGRFELIGHSDSGRMLVVVVEPVTDDEFYVVTARPASRKERRTYARQFGFEG
jgi:uncharacterized DUF497 family protein